MPEDQPPAPLEEHRFPCEQCGSDLEFTPGQTTLKCPHCGHVQDIDAEDGEIGAHQEIDFRSALGAQADSAEVTESRTVQCPSCGARTEFPETTQAARCPFCDTPVVTDTGLHRHIKPQAVLPFAIDEGTARAAMTKWLGRLWFAPNGLKDYARSGRPMSGVYTPYWTYDADTRSQYRGQRGDDYYETRTVRRGGKTETQRVRKTRWRSVSGRVARDFDDVLVLASHSLPKSYTDALAPWDLGAIQPYDPRFLAGFAAEAYQVDLEEGYTEAREIMDGIIRQDVRRDIGGDHQRITSLSTEVSDVTFKHVLLPVWLAAYKYRGRSFRFVVNGQTGKVQGERPWSRWKIAIAVVIGLIIAAGVAYVAYQNQ
jgi:DNA-directed RNA polymerase subunit RPC12/RpoP